MEEHYAEMTAEETGLIRALLQDKIAELEDGPEVPNLRMLQLLRGTLDKLGGPDGSRPQ